MPEDFERERGGATGHPVPPLGAECVATREDVEAAYERLARGLESRFPVEPPLLIAVLEGGRIPAQEISRRLRIAHSTDTLRVGRYGRSARGGRLTWHATPDSPLRNRCVVIIDDILDEGVTLAAVVEHCLTAGAREVLTCVLTEKALGERSRGLEPDLVGLTVPNRYIVGCGMDYQGKWRDLPALFALKEPGG